MISSSCWAPRIYETPGRADLAEDLEALFFKASIVRKSSLLAQLDIQYPEPPERFRGDQVQ